MRYKQKVVLEAIASYIEENGYSPTIRELCELLNLKSSSTVYTHILKLKKLGVVENKDNLPRTLKITEKGREMLKAYKVLNSKII